MICRFDRFLLQNFSDNPPLNYVAQVAPFPHHEYTSKYVYLNIHCKFFKGRCCSKWFKVWKRTDLFAQRLKSGRGQADLNQLIILKLQLVQQFLILLRVQLQCIQYRHCSNYINTKQTSAQTLWIHVYVQYIQIWKKKFIPFCPGPQFVHCQLVAWVC